MLWVDSIKLLVVDVKVFFGVKKLVFFFLSWIISEIYFLRFLVFVSWEIILRYFVIRVWRV